MVTLLVAGDLCPIRRNRDSFIKGDVSTLFNDLLTEFQEADLSIANLESPLIQHENFVLKSGSHLGADPKAINGIKKSGIKVLNIGNNHILDHGERGIETTLDVCKREKIFVVGAGKNLEGAGRCLEFKIENMNIGILSFAEQECSIAARDSAGANPLDLISYVRQMRSLKNRLDYLIVLLHGGKEHYPYPPPQLQRVCRFMVEEGANAVICQHSHCPGAYEEYKNAHIVYGQGNFIFDAYPRVNDMWCRGYLVKFVIDKTKTCEMRIIPYVQSDNRIGARRMKKEEEDIFIADLKKKSINVEDTEFVQNEWNQFSKTFKNDYFSIFRGHNRVFRFINRFLGFSDWFYSKQKLTVLQNIIRCESHREAILTMLENKIWQDML